MKLGLTPDGARSPSALQHRYETNLRFASHLVLASVLGLLAAAALLMLTVGQVVEAIDHASFARERQRAANAVDAMTEAAGPLTEERLAQLGLFAGLKSVHFATAPAGPSQQSIPLLAGQGPAGMHLAWTVDEFGRRLLLGFAPSRLPFILSIVASVIGLLFYLLRLVRTLERDRQMAREISIRDMLTGLANRFGFDNALARSLETGQPFTLLYLDLDAFKAVNDRFGHAAGDLVLRIVGERLLAASTPADLVARLGGDEFAILRLGDPSNAELSDFALLICEDIERPIPFGTQTLSVGVSLGIAPSFLSRRSADTLKALADAALYRAKSQRGSAYRFAAEIEGDLARSA